MITFDAVQIHEFDTLLSIIHSWYRASMYKFVCTSHPVWHGCLMFATCRSKADIRQGMKWFLPNHKIIVANDYTDYLECM